MSEDEMMNDVGKDSDSGCHQNSASKPLPIFLFLVLSLLISRQENPVA